MAKCEAEMAASFAQEKLKQGAKARRRWPCPVLCRPSPPGIGPFHGEAHGPIHVRGSIVRLGQASI